MLLIAIKIFSVKSLILKENIEYIIPKPFFVHYLRGKSQLFPSI
ncbi:hypothetical protein D088_690032 [Salmonella enterica subsp. houtenae serovar 16:z4,z32:-- str. RKS3027]|nr:hypothetical protein D088_690032 [Salmonella enterica subsp. houtenae serovar 16:z4,z32:-- str. RKS3027]